MEGFQWLILLRDWTTALTWFVAVVFFLSGCQDLLYDIGAYFLRGYRRFGFRDRERLTLERLRSREQQRIAVIVPAWNEGEVVGSMVDNILKRVEYRNYSIFVGVYPNDPATNAAVDRLAGLHSQIIKVVNVKPGPTTKADCLNNVYRTLKAFEVREGVNFDIVVMHDAEDVVNPYSFLLYNYLIPKVDAIQLPILPLPTSWRKWVHWSYADEFSETHMKDVPVREKISGFVPYAGTGTGFSRRVFVTMEEHGYTVFNETSMTEDYNMSKRIRELGMKSIFVNLVLADDRSPWWTPLCRRPLFIANWAYFPMDFKRAVRQKSRWVLGISLQEWEHGGWAGTLRIKENLIKDRKVFVAAGSSILGYLVLIYFILYAMGLKGWVPFQLLPVLAPGSTLATMVELTTFFMLVRMFERVVFVGMVYGIGPGLMSIPRLIVGNVINGLAAFRALQAFSWSRRGKAAVKWDNTTHLEGVGELPMGSSDKRKHVSESQLSVEEVLQKLSSFEASVAAEGLNALPRDLWAEDKGMAIQKAGELSEDENSNIRAAVARAVGFLQWPELLPTLLLLTKDRDWLVRANACKALLKQPKFAILLERAFFEGDPIVCQVLIQTLEQDKTKQHELFLILRKMDLPNLRHAIEKESRVLKAEFERSR